MVLLEDAVLVADGDGVGDGDGGGRLGGELLELLEGSSQPNSLSLV